jgi:nitrate reductase gamma subunit
MSDRALFAVAPYVAAACLAAVALLRYLAARETGRLTAQEASLARELFGGPRAWSLGVAGLAILHGALLAAPGLVLAWNQSPARLIALEAVFFAFGVIALVGLLDLVVAHVRDPAARAASSPADAAFLGLLVVEVVSGLGLAALYRWASSWSVVTLTPYLRSVAGLQPDVSFVASVPYLVKLHVFAGFALLAVFPFTHLLHAVLRPLDRAAALALAPAGRLLQGAGRRLADAARVGGRRLGWQEEED